MEMGKKGSDRGVLVLLAVDDHKYRIDVGYGLEGILNDAKVGDIGRAMVPALRAQDYDSAILGAVGRVAQVIATDAHVTLSDELPNPPPVPQRHSSGGLADLIPFIILILIFCGFGGLRLLFAMGLLNSALGGRRYMAEVARSSVAVALAAEADLVVVVAAAVGFWWIWWGWFWWRGSRGKLVRDVQF